MEMKMNTEVSTNTIEEAKGDEKLKVASIFLATVLNSI